MKILHENSVLVNKKYVSDCQACKQSAAGNAGHCPFAGTRFYSVSPSTTSLSIFGSGVGGGVRVTGEATLGKFDELQTDVEIFAGNSPVTAYQAVFDKQ